MPPVQAIIAKELRSYFVSPIVYVVGAVFLLTFGFLAYLYIVFTGAQAIQLMQMQGSSAQINLNDLVFRNLFASMRFVLLLILPILTMRLLAEERKLRTFEFLMTAPDTGQRDYRREIHQRVPCFPRNAAPHHPGSAHTGPLQRFRLVSRFDRLPGHDRCSAGSFWPSASLPHPSQRIKSWPPLPASACS
jgi:hypothetical protein